MKYLIVSVIIILFLAFLYWAYLPDYKREPKEFKRTIIGMPIGMLFGGLGFNALNDIIKRWAMDKGEKDKKKDKN
ncbi:hypothetical protein [Tenacibaculum sp.]|uniref:hypothetical protein n=1 Tax=Tenacibaculum sp. TaxID=1906242 RepID=UPI003AA95B9A